MKERNVRKTKDVKISNKRDDEYNQQLNSSIKGIHPDERPIKPAASYNFDEMPVGKASNKLESKSKVIQTQSKETTSKVQESSGGVMMAFDFSDPSPPPPKVVKKNFLKRKVEQKPKIEEIETPPKEDKTEENKSAKKSRFLKKGEKLIYDPLKAVKEAKLKKK